MIQYWNSRRHVTSPKLSKKVPRIFPGENDPPLAESGVPARRWSDANSSACCVCGLKQSDKRQFKLAEPPKLLIFVTLIHKCNKPIRSTAVESPSECYLSGKDGPVVSSGDLCIRIHIPTCERKIVKQGQPSRASGRVDCREPQNSA